jgi:hypothetical protein
MHSVFNVVCKYFARIVALNNAKFIITPVVNARVNFDQLLLLLTEKNTRALTR